MFQSKYGLNLLVFYIGERTPPPPRYIRYVSLLITLVYRLSRFGGPNEMTSLASDVFSSSKPLSIRTPRPKPVDKRALRYSNEEGKIKPSFARKYIYIYNVYILEWDERVRDGIIVRYHWYFAGLNSPLHSTERRLPNGGSVRFLG